MAAGAAGGGGAGPGTLPVDDIVAQVARVSVEESRIRVHKLVCAIDCGMVVNPDIVRQQMESAVAYGLSAALYGEVRVREGRVVQKNFHDVPMLRIDEMPVIESYLIPSTEAPGGMGEASTPGIAPAVGNAIFAATGKRLRRLPMRNADLA